MLSPLEILAFAWHVTRGFWVSSANSSTVILNLIQDPRLNTNIAGFTNAFETPPSKPFSQSTLLSGSQIEFGMTVVLANYKHKYLRHQIDARVCINGLCGVAINSDNNSWIAPAVEVAASGNASPDILTAAKSCLTEAP